MVDEDDDWFERALREDDPEAGDREDDAAPAGGADSGDGAEAQGPADHEDVTAGDREDADETAAAADPSLDDPADGADDGPFEDDFAAAFEATDGPDAVDDAAAFGGRDAGSDAGDLFQDDFATAFEGASDPGGGEFGFDLGDGGGLGGSFDDGDFDDDDFESEIPRIELGIEGLDNMIRGGVPERSLIVVMGSAGTGKTTFGLQFLEEALRNGESAVYITLEETRERIVSSATEKGWPFDEYEEEGRLAVVDVDPVEMANSLTSIRNELPELVEEFGASRLVLDSVSLLEMMYDDQAKRRSEVWDFTKSLKDAGVTTMLTSEASEADPYTSRYGIIEYLTDAVIVLRYIRPEDFRETRLAVEIQKIRDANHSRETKPYELGDTGISVYRQANIF